MAEQRVRDVMTASPVWVSATATLTEAAQKMRDHNIGDVLVLDGANLAGMLTDRDIVVRCLAAQLDPSSTQVGSVATAQTILVDGDAPVEKAVQLMRDNALRRLPVAEGDRVVGIVTLGDLAIDREPGSALADISYAEPNR
jgi:CBS domain-containing protein